MNEEAEKEWEEAIEKAHDKLVAKTSMPSGLKPEYLGDGVYASYEGDMIKLETERELGIHVIYLEQEVLANLVEYDRKIRS